MLENFKEIDLDALLMFFQDFLKFIFVIESKVLLLSKNYIFLPTKTSSMQSLQARVNELEDENASLTAVVHRLEDDNASLSQAAEEAASLAESLASDNEQLRADLQIVSKNLSDTELQVLRLSSTNKQYLSINERLKDKVRELKNEIEEQYKDLKSSDQMETTLRHTITKLQVQLQQQSKKQSPKSFKLNYDNEDIGLTNSFLSVMSFHSLLIQTLCQFMSEFIDVVDIRLLTALLSTKCIEILSSFTASTFPNGATAAFKLRDAIATAGHSARRAAVWIIQNDSSHNSNKRQSTNSNSNSTIRATKINDKVITLLERVLASAMDINRPSFPVTNAAPIEVQVGLLSLAIEAIDAYTTTSSISTTSSEVSVIDDPDQLVVWMKNTLKTQQQKTRQNSSGLRMVDETMKKANERLQKELKEKDKTIEDAYVRCEAFENALGESRKYNERLKKTNSDISVENDRKRLKVKSSRQPRISSDRTVNITTPSSLTTDQQRNTTSTMSDMMTENTTKKNEDDSEKTNHDVDHVTKSEDGTEAMTEKATDTSRIVEYGNEDIVSADEEEETLSTLTHSQQMKSNWNQLRSCYLSGALSNLKPFNHENINQKHELKSTYKKMTSALQRSRLAAANAHIVKLDSESLEPKTCGATMSHRPLLESIAAGRRTIITPSSSSTSVTKASCATQITKLQIIIPDGLDVEHVVNSLRSQMI